MFAISRQVMAFTDEGNSSKIPVLGANHNRRPRQRFIGPGTPKIFSASIYFMLEFKNSSHATIFSQLELSFLRLQISS